MGTEAASETAGFRSQLDSDPSQSCCTANPSVSQFPRRDSTWGDNLWETLALHYSQWQGPFDGKLDKDVAHVRTHTHTLSNQWNTTQPYKDEMLPFVPTRMDLENTTLSEISHVEKD